MSKKEFNPYRDMLDIPSLTDENPTDYQLLGIDDFEDGSEKIAAAYEKRSQRVAELYQLVTEMSGKIDAARDRLSDPKAKEEYDLNLQRVGRAGVPHLGKSGYIALLSSFVLSIFVVIISTFYIYPMVVAVPVDNIGDSVTTLQEYRGDQTKKEMNILKTQQEDITTMDVNFNMPIDVDADSSVEFLDVPTTDIPGEETSIDDLPLDDASSMPEESTAPEESTLPEVTPVEEPSLPEPPAVEEPAVEEPSLPEPPAVEEPAVEEPSLPEPPAVEEPAVEEPSLPEPPAVEEPAVEEPSSPEPPAVEEPAVEEPSSPEPPAVEEPALQKPTASIDTAAPDSSSISAIPSDTDTPTTPKLSDFGSFGIPELPPLEDVTVSEPPGAPEPPVIPELTVSSQTPAAPSENVVLEDVDKLEHFVRLGQQARTDADFTQLLSSAKQAEDKLMKERAFYKAQQIADVVYESCARSADKTYRSEAFRQKDIVSKRSRLWGYVSAAEAKMASEGTVSSSEANLVARWKIEIERDWQAGLQYLTLSDNEQVRNAAKNEIDANQTDVRNVLTVANGWWNLSQDPVPMQRSFREHACTWYAKALPSISDKQIRILVEKRISMAESGYPKR